MNRISKGAALVAVTGALVLASAGIAGAEGKPVEPPPAKPAPAAPAAPAPAPESCLVVIISGTLADPVAAVAGLLADPGGTVTAVVGCVVETLGLA